MFAKIPQAVMTLVGGAALAAILSWHQPAVAQEPFLGELSFVGFNFAPKGWALCNGQLLPINQNQALFALLGTTYGGNGTTTFALPDMQGRIPLHAGAGPGLTPRNLGETGGAETVTLTVAQLPSHGHNATTTVTVTATERGSTTLANSGSPPGAVLSNTRRNNTYSTAAPDVDMASGAVAVTSTSATTTIGNTGGNQPINNLQPYTVVNCIIALTGIFPSRN